ncbi:MAG: MFS transporter [Sulfurihydrogenibium sp.]|nr:MAG: MFS transporter [Sulfurihydrogenibium sp.]
MIDKDFTPQEKKITVGLAFIFSLRMFGLFLALPVLSVYAKNMPGSDAFWAGLAIGAYGLTQAIFQIPYGLWSDKIGRKPIIISSTIIFVLGSFLAAYASYIESIHLLVVGRFLQGIGAVSSVIIALLADMTREEIRTRAMATIGASIGMAFAFGMVLGPLIASFYGLTGIFLFTGILGLISLPYVIFGIKEPPNVKHHEDAEFTSSYLSVVLKDKNLLKMDFGMFVLHMTLTAVFTAVPLIFAHQHSIDLKDIWKIYLLMFFVGLTIMVPSTIIAEKKGKIKQVKMIAIVVLIISFVMFLMFKDNFYLTVLAIVVYFTGFMMLEPIMPSLMSKYAKPHVKGTASGVFNTAQFLGAFVGGAVGGLLLKIDDSAKLNFIFLIVLTVIWLILVSTMEMPVKGLKNDTT